MSQVFSDMIFAPRELTMHLVDELLKRKHEVYLASTGDIETSTTQISGNMKMLDLASANHRSNLPKYEREHVEFLIKRDFELDLFTRTVMFVKKEHVDVIHAYQVAASHYFDNLFAPTPVVYTLHDPLPKPGSLGYIVFSMFANHNYISISNSQRNSDLPLNYIATVYHGVQLTDFPFIANPSDSLLFMGRLMPEKGLHDAIAASLKTKIKLEIGTQFPAYHEENPYFDRQIKPFLDNVLIGEPGLVGEEKKARLYGNAKALLFPIHWEEPFGMVMIEAMACGTPVIAYNRGSVSEIVRDGVTGFIVEPEDQGDRGNTRDKGKWKTKKPGVAGLVEAIQRIGEIDRAACRAHVEEHFTVEKMVEGYEKVYEKILYGKSGK